MLTKARASMAMPIELLLDAADIFEISLLPVAIAVIVTEPDTAVAAIDTTMEMFWLVPAASEIGEDATDDRLVYPPYVNVTITFIAFAPPAATVFATTAES